MDPILAIYGIGAAIETLKSIKGFFYDDSKLNETRIQAQKDAESIEQLLEQHAELINDLIDQLETSKEVIEKHNEILLTLGAEIELTKKEAAKFKLLAYGAICISVVSVGVSVLIYTR